MQTILVSNYHFEKHINNNNIKNKNKNINKNQKYIVIGTSNPTASNPASNPTASNPTTSNEPHFKKVPPPPIESAPPQGNYIFYL